MLDVINELNPDGARAVLIIIISIMSLIQVAPVKLNPWSWLAKQVGEAVNGKVFRRLDVLENDLRALSAKTEERTVVEARSRITLFADELLQGQRHSKDAFDHILTDIDYYADYCERHPAFRNEITMASVAEIKRVYTKCRQDRDFL